ncbi:cytochrome c biogenesis protein CcdA [Piscinibacter sp.]|uniref:cytochrome c biogenesis protein CcdA n=1 Tax=Piscinibacter sp. TaxID=1903157 RepID=UPI002D10FE11|nr:cytochrome c biogenesis protein CcdA [Albitalea sp.]HUG25494.1 cytochrome c biogenesis protein CcdA [Albitalea sp.]
MLFGLFGFIEPCTIGSTLVIVKQIEERTAAQRIVQTLVFALTRALFIGAAGLLAAVLGSAFLGLQKAAWLLLGVVYIALGLLYVLGKAGVLMRSFGPSLSRMRDVRGSVLLGLLFGLNIPACAAPLILALLGASAAGGATGAALASGFVSLALFGLALSLPLVIAVFFEPARRGLDWLAALSRRVPVWTGMLLIALGLWSVWFAFFVTLDA